MDGEKGRVNGERICILRASPFVVWMPSTQFPMIFEGVVKEGRVCQTLAEDFRISYQCDSACE